VLSASGIAPEVNPIRYRGYYWDDEIGMYYLQSRYYNPEWGRFLNADCMIVAGNVLTASNMYAYANGNPVMMVDKTGREADWIDAIDWGKVGFYAFVGIGIVVAFPWVAVFNIVPLMTQEDFDNIAQLVNVVVGVLGKLLGGAVSMLGGINWGGLLGGLFKFVAAIFGAFVEIIGRLLNRPKGNTTIFEVDGKGYMMSFDGEVLSSSNATYGMQAQSYNFSLLVFQEGKNVTDVGLINNGDVLFGDAEAMTATLWVTKNIPLSPNATVKWELSNTSNNVQITRNINGGKEIDITAVGKQSYVADLKGAVYPDSSQTKGTEIGYTQTIKIYSVEMWEEFLPSITTKSMVMSPVFVPDNKKSEPLSAYVNIALQGTCVNYNLAWANPTAPSLYGLVIGLVKKSDVGQLGSGEVLLTTALDNNHQKAISFGNTTDPLEKFVRIALSQEGYYSGVYANGRVTFPYITDDPSKTGRWTKYGPNVMMEKSPGSGILLQMYPNSGAGDWCAAFVSWCAERAGISNDIFFYHSYAWAMRKNNVDYRSNYTTYFARSSTQYTPQRGDVVYFDWDSGDDIDHVGLVYDVDSTYVYTIEGNSKHDVTGEIGGVYKKKHLKTYTCIVGYTRINF